MTPYLEDADLTIYVGDSREVLADVPDGTVDLVVTSPPFFGLRDYGTGRWEGGDQDCDHAAPTSASRSSSSIEGSTATLQASHVYREVCARCGARRIDSQIGLEDTPEGWVASLVEVFEQCRRALKPTGCLVVECGDSYASNVPYYAPDSINSTASVSRDKRTRPGLTGTLKSKDLIGAPFELALALRDAGWVWRGSYVWNKPNPMPESVTDRCTTSHSMILHFSKARWTGPDPGRFAALSEIDRRWLAAMIDTEGSIMVRRSRRDGADNYAAQVTFVNTDDGLLAKYQLLLGGDGSITRKPHGSSARRPCWSIVVSNKIARDLLLSVYPYLIAKKRQARIAIYAQGEVRHRGGAQGVQGAGATRPQDESDLLERCWSATKACNKGDAPDLSWVPEPTYGSWRSQPYYWDPVAILEEASSSDGPTTKTRSVRPGVDVNGGSQGNGTMTWPRGTRNARSVWTIATEPTGMGICPICLHYWTRNAPAEHCGGRVVKHYAAFPQALAEKAILAGTSERGCCPGCGAPWERVVEKGAPELAANTWSANGAADQDEEAAPSSSLKHVREVRTLGWEPTCSCAAGEPVAAVVLDPFAGSGTAAVVARRLGRSSVAVELNPAYAEMIARRLAQQSLLA